MPDKDKPINPSRTGNEEYRSSDAPEPAYKIPPPPPPAKSDDK